MIEVFRQLLKFLGQLLAFLSYRVLRVFIVTLGFVQRLPMILFFSLGVCFFWVLFKGARLHRPLLYFVKACTHLHFFLNGIRIRTIDPFPKEFDQKVILANYIRPIDRVILFLLLPYKKLVFMPKSFFDNNRLKWMFYALGVYPAEVDFDIRSYEKTTFRAEPYVDAGFALTECVEVMHQHLEPVPYTFMIALKKKLSVLFLQIEGSEQVVFTTFFTPKRITVRLIDDLQVSRRPEITVVHYQNVIKKYKEYEKTRRGPKTVAAG